VCHRKNVHLLTLVQQYQFQKYRGLTPFILISSERKIRLPPSLLFQIIQNHDMSWFSGMFAALEFLPGTRRRVYGSNVEDQDFEMQTPRLSMGSTGLHQNDNENQKNGEIKKRSQRNEGQLPCAADTSGFDSAACKRVWREWWI
jgi:hypothetical protein